MNDADLFALGCGVTFIALCGAYVYLRERFMDGTPRTTGRTRQAQIERPEDERAHAARGAGQAPL